ncbi:VanW family protein [Rhodococcus sp. CC-R104]|uniref:VanW family protein n=2 Tax=Rhodococcus chondri TaxID=3065941 RepID=A0ABU7JSK3_9NOCA|nr:VanW family protein [Rhodococcus sp. CC-R104]MEE2032737.1 VanW family protein [Rhodococcus sp. CC-R104]
MPSEPATPDSPGGTDTSSTPVQPWDEPTGVIPVVGGPGTPPPRSDTGAPAPEPGSEAMTDKIHRTSGQPAEPVTPPPAMPPATASMPPASPPPASPPPPSPPPGGNPEHGGEQPGGPRSNPSNRTIALVLGGIVAVLALLYGVDLALSSGKVPRGVTVAGIEIGGEPVDEAEAILRDELGARLNAPVAVAAGDTSGEIVPSQAGLDVDWDATLGRVGSQPLNPFTRVGSFFGNDEIGVVSTRDDAALAGAITRVTAAAAYEPREGNIVFEAGTPVPVTPQPGQRVDLAGAVDVFAERWPFGDVSLPVESVDVTVTREGLDRALAEVAVPAVSADVTVRGNDGTVATLAREQVGAVLSFVPDGSGGLEPQYHPEAAIEILRPQLAATETEPKNAQIVLQGGRPTVVPGVRGELVDWDPTLAPLPQLLSASGERSVDAIYRSADPELTTEAAEKLGIREVIGEFTSGGFEYASGVNIRLAASEINGALVKPGETFSLNGYTGPRGTAQGYVESGIIDAGRPGKAVGGGISQLATTLYNASYFAGMEDVEHTEHSYYISRYPAAREATVFEGAIDLKFRNPFETGVLIQAIGTNSDITVRIWGTKTVDVQSITGQRTAFTSPNTITLPAGEGCIPSSGAQGFTVSDTRIVTDARTGAQISNTTRTVRYDPVPIVKCVSPEPAPRDNDAPADAPGPAEGPDAPPVPEDTEPGAAAPEDEPVAEAVPAVNPVPSVSTDEEP